MFKKVLDLNIEEIQEITLDILHDIYCFSQEYGIEVFLLGGTALGAYRDGGLIPWDDDLDIGMLRDDYKLFLDNYQPKNETYKFMKEHDYNSYVPYSRVVDTKTQAKSTFYQINHGVFVDVFPIDAVTNNKCIQVNYWGWHKILNVLRNTSRSTGIFPKEAKLKKIKSCIYKLGNHSQKEIHYWVERELSWSNRLLNIPVSNNNFAVGVVNGVYGFRELLSPELLAKRQKVTFYGMQLYIFGNIEEYLEIFFGKNWRTPLKRGKHAEFIRNGELK